jgi:hypothetical protein
MVFRDGKAEPDEEYSNSYGTAAMVWTALLDKYYEVVYPNESFMAHRTAGINGGWEALWVAVAEHRVPLREWERIVLKWTYDNALMRGSELVALADALDRFEDAFKKPNHVCHLAAIAKRLRELQDVDAVGLYATSVVENPWVAQETCEPDEDEDPDEVEPDYRPYDLNRDEKHWFVRVTE